MRQAVSHLFNLFARTGSARAVVKAFKAEGLLFPLRVRTGTRKGELAWAPLRHWRVLRTLHNPRYAGAFVYGRRKERTTPEGRRTFDPVPRDQWIALIPDAHPGYITFESYELNQKLLASNAKAHGQEREAGPAREGPALLQGLVLCGRCGRRMTVRYHLRSGMEFPDYQCQSECIETGVSRCQSVPGAGVDEAIARLLLDTVTPMALEVALSIQGELEARAEEADHLRRAHVQRACHHADLARRRYLAVDPDNRLVADTLEADWNDSLRAVKDAQEDYERASATALAALTDEHKARVLKLATDFPSLWSDPSTPQRERKRMARLLIEDITVMKTDQIHLHVRLRGRQGISLQVPIPPTGWPARQTEPETLAMLNRLLDDHTDAETAEALNRAGCRSGMGKSFTAGIVLHLRRSNDLPDHAQRLRSRGLLTLNEISAQLGVHPSTVKAWHRAGLLVSHKANDKNQRLFESPLPDDPRLVKRMGSKGGVHPLV